MTVLGIIGIIAGLLPFAALFLPLGVLSYRILLSSDIIQVNLVEIIKLLTGERSGMPTGLMSSGQLGAMRQWLFAVAASLAVCMLAMLAGLALGRFKGKALSFAAAVYILGALGGFAWAYFFPLFAGRSLLYSAQSRVLWGSWALIALMLLNAGLCIFRRINGKTEKGKKDLHSGEE